MNRRRFLSWLPALPLLALPVGQAQGSRVVEVTISDRSVNVAELPKLSLVSRAWPIDADAKWLVNENILADLQALTNQGTPTHWLAAAMSRHGQDTDAAS